jgi:ribosomal protein S4E
MGKAKSFLQTISIDKAIKSHSCKHNKKHIINKGDIRLKLKVGRTFQHFCIECAKESLEKDIKELNTILIELNETKE